MTNDRGGDAPGPAQTRAAASTAVYRTQAAERSRSRAAHWHWPGPRRPFGPVPGSACSDHRLAREHGRDPATVPLEQRCRGRGCREHWRAIDAGPNLLTALPNGGTP